MATTNRSLAKNAPEHQAQSKYPAKCTVTHRLNLRCSELWPIPLLLLSEPRILIRQQIQQAIATFLEVTALPFKLLDIVLLSLAELPLGCAILLPAPLFGGVKFVD